MRPLRRVSGSYCLSGIRGDKAFCIGCGSGAYNIKRHLLTGLSGLVYENGTTDKWDRSGILRNMVLCFNASTVPWFFISCVKILFLTANEVCLENRIFHVCKFYPLDKRSLPSVRSTS